MLWLTLGVLGLYPACATSNLAGAPRETAPSKRLEDPTSPSAPPTVATVESLPLTSGTFAPPLPAQLDAGEVPRQELLTLLQAGIPHLLNRIQVEATLEGNAFAGWRIVAMDAALARASVLRPGDIVQTVNDLSLSRPDELIAIWETLPGAREVHIDMWRGDQPSRIRYRIVDDPLAVTQR